ncbi:hypothetical protein TrVE_jg11434 [Triparma verrucosa]|uniref:WW domain-containing protein n=1 Tax=Triparma verrucosa TaxID=1606542 RepID=A0A9W7FB94_9STRA|nr:hypothetical protein TrVE_jg11434 [Triparma verrucosa]
MVTKENELHGKITINLDSDAHLRAAMAIQRLIRVRMATRRLRTKISEAMFTKRLDMKHGVWYYKNQRSGETTWDVPRGNIPMQPMPEPFRRSIEKEKQDIRLNKLKEKEKRDFLIEQRKEEYKQEQIKHVSQAEQAERDRRDQLWADAVEHGKLTGELNMSWQKLGDISERVYNFRRTSARDLTHLRLVGHEMEVVPAKLATSCNNIISLSLTSNRLTDVEAVAQLTKLTSLTLLRNKLTKLPASMGNLVRLSVLELASNRLESLPATFGNLTGLSKLNLECNRLRRIPETLSRLTIKALNLNSNDLVTLPHCISSMPNLSQLSCNDNKLKYLPGSISESNTLQAIHVCNNRIMELPDTLGQLTTLTNLWLDFNNLTALPMSFHKLDRLTELKMEGNAGMVFPTMDKIIRGPKTVLAWSKKRFSTSLFARQQSIVLTFQDMLKQVGKHSIGGEEHRGIYEKNVKFDIPGKAKKKETKGKPEDSLAGPSNLPEEEGEGELFYQYPEEMFWDTFLPALEEIWNEGSLDTAGDIRSFPYSRKEAERVMNSFEDPYGPVIYRSPTGWFRRCVCKKPDGSRNVCIPPKAGWMCERPVMLVKMHITLERELEERQRQAQERKTVKEASEAAEKSAKEYLETDEGQIMIRKMAEARAHELQHSEANSKFKGALELEFRRKRKRLEKAFKKKEKKLQAKRNEAHDEMEKKKDALMEKGKELVGWAAEQNDIQIDKLLDTLANLPEDALLTQLVDKYEADLAKIVKEIEKKAAKGSLAERILPKALIEFKNSMTKDHNEKLNELMVDLKRQYVERESYRARKKVKMEHIKLRKIMGAWTGLGLRENFDEWKVWTKHRVRQRRRDIRKKNRENRFQYEQEMANKDFAVWNLNKWQRNWDEYNDLPYWVHNVTGESTYDEPDIEAYIPKGWVEPDPPECMKDAATGELLSPRSLRIKEADTPSEASEIGSDDDSDEEWKAQRGLGGDGEDSDDETPAQTPAAITDGTEEKKDDAVTGMVPVDGSQTMVAEIPVTVDKNSVGFADSDEVQLAGGDIVNRPSTSNTMVVRPLTNEMGARSRSVKGLKAEQDAAAARILKRRRIQIKRRMQREGLLGEDGENGKQSDIAKMLAKQEAEEAEKNRQPTELEVMIQCGFDPAKGDDYSQKELDQFAMKAIKMNKAMGRTANGGVGDLVDENGQAFGHYEPSMFESFFNKRKQKKELKQRLAEERAKKYGGDVGGKGNSKEREDQEPTGLGTVFSRQGPRET